MADFHRYLVNASRKRRLHDGGRDRIQTLIFSPLHTMAGFSLVTQSTLQKMATSIEYSNTMFKILTRAAKKN